MAEVNDMFSKVTEEQSFFNPKKKSISSCIIKVDVLPSLGDTVVPDGIFKE